MLADKRYFDPAEFSKHKPIEVPAEESMATNVLRINGVVSMYAGFYRTVDPLRNKEFDIPKYFGASQGRSWTEHYSLRRRYMRIPRARVREPLWKKKVPNPKKKRLPETILSSNNDTEPT